MALITDFSARTKDRQRVHEPVECGYSTFSANGVSYLQLDTYGRQGRAIPGKTSQSLQLDGRSATELLKILREHFPEI